MIRIYEAVKRLQDELIAREQSIETHTQTIQQLREENARVQSQQNAVQINTGRAGEERWGMNKHVFPLFPYQLFH